MAFNKITNADLVGKGVVGLPDVPGLSTGAMQAKFDELSLDVIVPAYNALIDLLNGTGVADNSQITDPTDSVVKSLQALANSLKSYIDTRDATKADIATTLAGYGITDAYTKAETDAALGTKADVASSLAGYGIMDAYTKTEADNLLAGKADNGTTLADYGITDAYTKVQTNALLNTKADVASTLNGYGIADAYTKTEVDTALSGKVDKVAGKDLSTNDYDDTEKSENAANTAARHTHSNKATLDAIDATTKTNYDALVTLLAGITSITDTVIADPAAIPTAQAIVDYAMVVGAGDMVRAVYDQNLDGIVDDSTGLDGKSGSYYTDSANHSYDNTTSGLSASTTKDAIDELANPDFTEAVSRTNIASGESIKTILGKIKKWFTDLKAVAFSGAAEDVTYDNTTSGLSATDAQDAIDELAKPTFTEAATRANIDSGESFTTILGKIKKFFADLKTVAFTGSYSDLSNKPTIPAAQVNADWNASSGVAQILNKPTIPGSPGNGTLTIQRNGTTVATFTANQSGNTTANITDNNTTYSAGYGLALSRTSFSLNNQAVLANGSLSASLSNTKYYEANITLSDSMTNYKELIVVFGEMFGGTDFRSAYVAPVALLTSGCIMRNRMILAYFNDYSSIQRVSNTSIKMHWEMQSNTNASFTLKYYVIGVK